MVAEGSVPTDIGSPGERFMIKITNTFFNTLWHWLMEGDPHRYHRMHEQWALFNAQTAIGQTIALEIGCACFETNGKKFDC